MREQLPKGDVVQSVATRNAAKAEKWRLSLPQFVGIVVTIALLTIGGYAASRHGSGETVASTPAPANPPAASAEPQALAGTEEEPTSDPWTDVCNPGTVLVASINGVAMRYESNRNDPPLYFLTTGGRVKVVECVLGEDVEGINNWIRVQYDESQDEGLPESERHRYLPDSVLPDDAPDDGVIYAPLLVLPSHDALNKN